MPDFLKQEIEGDVVKMLREVAESDSIVRLWENKKYGDIQRITNPKKGDFGEKFIGNLLTKFGYECEVLGRERARGGDNVDLLVDLNNDNEKERVEVKLATKDVNGSYQFGWIPVDYDYSLIIFLGINPDAIYLSIKTKDEIKDYIENPKRGRTLTPVPTRENPTHRKWTTNPHHADMVEVKTYEDIKNILDAGIDKFLNSKNHDLQQAWDAFIEVNGYAIVKYGEWFGINDEFKKWGATKRKVRIVAQANAGRALHAPEESLLGYIFFDDTKKVDIKKNYAIQVDGDSMNSKKINGKFMEHGDYALVQPNVPVEEGDVVVSIVGDGVNIKELHRDGGEVVLQSCSKTSKYKDLRVGENDYTYLGKVIDVLKDNAVG